MLLVCKCLSLLLLCEGVCVCVWVGGWVIFFFILFICFCCLLKNIQLGKNVECKIKKGSYYTATAPPNVYNQ